MKAFRNDLGMSNDNRNEFVEIFNSVEIMKKYYPETYAAYNNTILGKEDSRSGHRDEYVDVEIINIGYADKDKKAIVIDVTGNAGCADGYCILKPTIQNRAGQELESAAEDNFLGNSQYASLYVPISQADGDTLDLDLVTYAYTVDNRVTQYSSRINLSPYLLDFTPEFTIEHPAKQQKKKDGLLPTDINICYFYALPGYDYYRNWKQLSHGNLCIPNSGRIKVKDLNMETLQSASLSAENSAHTKRYHTNAFAGVTVSDSETIEWEISEDWGFPFKTLLVDIYEYIIYTLTIAVNCRGEIATFVITNAENSAKAINKKKIEKINIYRDCFTEGTEILLSDGTKKRAEDLKKEDRLKSQDGRTAEIADVAAETSTQILVHIQTENGQELFLTECHPVVTDQGLRCAVRLENGDTLMTIDGPCKIRQVCANPAEEVKCISLTLTDSTQRIYANGILTADAVAEMTETEKEMTEKYQISEKWRRDYDGWRARNRGEHA